MIRTSSAFSSRLAIHPICTLYYVPVPRIVRLLKRRDTVEVGTKRGRGVVNQPAGGGKVIAPGITIDSLARGSRRWLRGYRCRGRSDNHCRSWFDCWLGSWRWCRVCRGRKRSWRICWYDCLLCWCSSSWWGGCVPATCCRDHDGEKQNHRNNCGTSKSHLHLARSCLIPPPHSAPVATCTHRWLWSIRW